MSWPKTQEIHLSQTEVDSAEIVHENQIQFPLFSLFLCSTLLNIQVN